VAKPNWLEDLTDQQRQAVLLGADALSGHAAFSRKSYDLWMAVARGVAVLCTLADRPGTSRKARKNLLKDAGYGTLAEGTVSRLLLMAKHETPIRVWRDSLTQNQRDRWNSPSSICNRCSAVRAAIVEANKNKPVRNPRKQAPALEPLLDKLLDLIAAVDDYDNRLAIIERVKSQVGKLAGYKPEPDDEPEPTKPKRKSRAKAEAEPSVYTRHAGLGIRVRIPIERAAEPTTEPTKPTRQRKPRGKAKPTPGLTEEGKAALKEVAHDLARGLLNLQK
jgi:hypothetical protein